LYSVVAEDTEPMTESDIKILQSVGGEDVIERCLNRQLICPKPETVVKRLKELGWDEKVVEKEGNKSAKGTKFEETVEDDYSFQRTESSSDEDAEAVAS